MLKTVKKVAQIGKSGIQKQQISVQNF